MLKARLLARIYSFEGPEVDILLLLHDVREPTKRNFEIIIRISHGDKARYIVQVKTQESGRYDYYELCLLGKDILYKWK